MVGIVCLFGHCYVVLSLHVTQDSSPTWTGPQWQPGHRVSWATGDSHG